jgi:hypothetical protein
VTTKISKKKKDRKRKKREKVNQRKYLQAGARFLFSLNTTKKANYFNDDQGDLQLTNF